MFGVNSSSARLRGETTWRRTPKFIAFVSAATLVVGTGLISASSTGASVRTPSSLTPAARVAAHQRTHLAGSAPHALAAAPRVTSHTSVFRTFTVNTNGDPSSTSCANSASVCSLRAALLAANGDPSHVFGINIASGRHIVLSMGPINITTSVVINGTGASVDGGGSQIFYIDSNAGVVINGLRMQNGFASYGGAIECNSGSLLLSGVLMANNAATTDGGAIYTNRTCGLWIDKSTFVSNNASVTGSGGAMYLYGGAVISNSTFGGVSTANSNWAKDGGSIYNYYGNVRIVNSTFQNNAAHAYAYGVGLYDDELTAVINCKFSNNSLPYGGYGAGVYNSWELTMTATSFNGNAIAGSSGGYGVGLYDDGTNTNLTGVTFAGNTSRASGTIDGGAVYSDASSFGWRGGSIVNTLAGAVGATNTIYGGALYLNASNSHVDGVSITNTQVRAGSLGTIKGGAIYNSSDGALTNVKVTGTINGAGIIYGGAFVNESDFTLTNFSATSTSNFAPKATGGDIYGGAIYNDSGLVANGIVINGVNDLANLGSAPASSTTAYVEGGAFYNNDDAEITGLSIMTGTVVAGGGDGSVYGGGIYTVDALTANNMQVLGFHVTADNSIYGGLVYNDSTDQFNSTNFTIGNSVVKAPGGPHASPSYADGSLLLNEGYSDIVNGTIANNTGVVAKLGEYNWGIENTLQLNFTDTTIANNTLLGPVNDGSQIGAGTVLLGTDGTANTRIHNTILVSAAPAKNCYAYAGGITTSMGYNMVNSGGCALNKPGDQAGPNAKVAPIANNGGSVWTAALMPGSPAINAGSNAGCWPTDARGVARPQHGVCDIGSYEKV